MSGGGGGGGGQMGRKSVILFYASLRGLLTLKRQNYGLYTDGESYQRLAPQCLHFD